MLTGFHVTHFRTSYFLGRRLTRILFGQPPQADEASCKDQTWLTRMRDCALVECPASKEFDAVEMPVGAKGQETVTKRLEGETHSYTYFCNEKISALQLGRNIENALKASGIPIVYTHSSPDDYTFTTHAGNRWSLLQADTFPPYRRYVISSVTVKQMEQEMKASAESWAGQMATTGRAIVNGINFDTGKATIKPESEPVLAEIIKLLNSQPDWKMRVEGHTDNVGAKAANMTLSQQRAAAVVAWLMAHNIPAARLTSQGFGDMEPIADNSTEEGRTQNRRVELVKR
jgi:OmpA-OmpF porin, OOP family